MPSLLDKGYDLVSELTIEHVPLILYFFLIFSLLALILPAEYGGGRTKLITAPSFTFILLSVSALLFTWFYMFLYFERSFIESALRANVRPQKYTSKEWLASTSLFYEAWNRVCETPWRWIWSQALCGWTVGPLTVFLESQAKRGKLRKPWAYMLLGQVVAVSFAQSIAFSVLSLPSTDGKTIAAPPRGVKPVSTTLPSNPSAMLWICVLSGLVTVGLTPSTIGTSYFLPNLLVMHALLIIPLLPTIYKAPSSSTSSSTFGTYKTLYYTIATTLLLLRLATLSQLLPSISSLSFLPAIRNLPLRSLTILLEHPAQTSIGFDVIFVSYSWFVFEVMEYGKREEGRKTMGGWVKLVALGILTPLLGVGVTASVWLAGEEQEEGVGRLAEKPKEKEVAERKKKE